MILVSRYRPENTDAAAAARRKESILVLRTSQIQQNSFADNPSPKLVRWTRSAAARLEARIERQHDRHGSATGSSDGWVGSGSIDAKHVVELGHPGPLKAH